MKVRRVVAEPEIYLNFEKVQVHATEDQMFMDFVKRVLIPWYHVGKRKGLPRDIVRMIALHYIPVDFQLHPVYEYLRMNKDRPHILYVHIAHPRQHKAFKLMNVPFGKSRICDYVDRNEKRRVGTRFEQVLVFTLFGDIKKTEHLLPPVCPEHGVKIIKL